MFLVSFCYEGSRGWLSIARIGTWSLGHECSDNLSTYNTRKHMFTVCSEGLVESHRTRCVIVVPNRLQFFVIMGLSLAA